MPNLGIVITTRNKITFVQESGTQIGLYKYNIDVNTENKIFIPLLGCLFVNDIKNLLQIVLL